MRPQAPPTHLSHSTLCLHARRFCLQPQGQCPTPREASGPDWARGQQFQHLSPPGPPGARPGLSGPSDASFLGSVSPSAKWGSSQSASGGALCSLRPEKAGDRNRCPEIEQSSAVSLLPTPRLYPPRPYLSCKPPLMVPGTCFKALPLFFFFLNDSQLILLMISSVHLFYYEDIQCNRPHRSKRVCLPLETQPLWDGGGGGWG